MNGKESSPKILNVASSWLFLWSKGTRWHLWVLEYCLTMVHYLSTNLYFSYFKRVESFTQSVCIHIPWEPTHYRRTSVLASWFESWTYTYWWIRFNLLHGWFWTLPNRIYRRHSNFESGCLNYALWIWHQKHLCAFGFYGMIVVINSQANRFKSCPMHSTNWRRISSNRILRCILSNVKVKNY